MAAVLLHRPLRHHQRGEGVGYDKVAGPEQPRLRRVNRGLVLESEPRSTAYNATDANYVTDAQGGAWLTFGSFFGELKIVALDPATGKVAAGAQVLPLV